MSLHLVAVSKHTWLGLRGTGLAMVVLSFVAVSLGNRVAAQSKSRPSPMDYSSVCTKENAVDMIRQQIDATKVFDNTIQRIAVLVRAANQLWPYQEEKARSTFAEAFALAILNFKEKEDKQSLSNSRLAVSTPDQRYVVIRAVASRDLVWARKLTEQILKADAEALDADPTQSRQRGISTAAKLLETATSLVSSDPNTATIFAKRSLDYPASVRLPIFLYSLAEVNQNAADQFYENAFLAYRDTPMTEFLYLSGYPFGNNREVGEMPSTAIYRVPTNFVPNRALQRIFVQMLLLRAQRPLEVSPNGSGSQNSDQRQIWLALTRLEPQVAQNLPELLAATLQASANTFALLPQATQQSVTQTITRQNFPIKTFQEQVEAAENERNPDTQDQLLVFAVIRSSEREKLDQVVSAAEKIHDSTAREQLLNWLYFNRVQSAIKDQRMDDARVLAAKVVDLDQRAYLYSEIAKEALKTIENRTLALELLDEVAAAAAKAPNTVITARTLLAVAYLYTKIDMNRSVSVLNDAIKCINRIEAVDFTSEVVIRKIEAKTFGTYAMFRTPGFNPENTFTEMGKLYFDTALSQSGNFTDKSLRALTMLALADVCLVKVQQRSRDPRTNKKH